jgi:polyphosphate kinase
MRRVLALILALAGAPALAHPHVFVETGLTLTLDAEGRLQSVGVVWVYDELTSLLALEDLGLDPDGDGTLTDPERAVLTDLAADWGNGFDGDLRVRAAGVDLPLSGPESARGDLRDGRVVFSHTRLVRDAPMAEVVVSAFDPTYFTYYELLPAPMLQGPEGCALRVDPADWGAAQRMWDEALMLLTEDEVMNEDNLPLLGEAFADQVVLTCG